MRRAALLAAALAGALVLAETVTAVSPERSGPRLLVARGGSVVSVGPQEGGTQRLLRGAAGAAWSPDGTLIAFERAGNLWLANADGSGRRALTATPRVVESEPSWSPGGRVLAYTALVESRLQVRLLRLPFGANRRVALGWSPAFSPDGRRLAFVSDRGGAVQVLVARADGSRAAPFGAADPATADLRDLAWSPDGRRLAATAELVDGTTRVVVKTATTRRTLPAAGASQPVWSPDGRRLAFASAAGEVVVASASGAAARVRGRGTPLDWQRVPLGRPRFPDLLQRPPSGLVVTRVHGKWQLGFTSLVDNRGPGVLWIHGARPALSPLMHASQRIALVGGATRVVPGVGFLHFTVAPPHYHWHLLGYDRYELRREDDFRLVVRDYKSGFCLADHYGIALGMGHGPPRFLGRCGQYEPRLRTVEQGTSVGYTDRYPAYFHGQSLNLSGVAAGRYWLVHRVNSDLGLRERNYDNNAASLLVRISWPGGRHAAPRVTRLRTCSAARC